MKLLKNQKLIFGLLAISVFLFCLVIYLIARNSDVAQSPNVLSVVSESEIPSARVITSPASPTPSSKTVAKTYTNKPISTPIPTIQATPTPYQYQPVEFRTPTPYIPYTPYPTFTPEPTPTPTPTVDSALILQHQQACDAAAVEWISLRDDWVSQNSGTFSSSVEEYNALVAFKNSYQKELYDAGCSNTISI